MDATRLDVLGTPFSRLGAWLDDLGVGSTHASRVFRGLHRDRVDLSEVRDLGRHAAVVTQAGWWARADLVERVPAPGGVERVVFALHDGARVEGVVLPSAAPGRATLCLSSQVGCAMGCAFCATGTLGLTRSLSAGEIVAQVHAVRAHLEGSGRALTHLVFMGMGEPLHAYGAVRDALHVLFDQHGDPFDRKKVTVSTVGLVDRMARLLDDFDGRIQLALSLHAGSDATRRRIIPSARASSLSDLRGAAEAYEARAKGRLLVEYVVLPGVNDTEAELAGLADWMRGLRGIVNLIPFNPFPGMPFRSPSDDEVGRVAGFLRDRDIPVSVRWPRGRAAQGACGQLMLAPAGAPSERTPEPAS
ncbi:MAG: 23S rRNA (adenine(2503)-C(2))-methyltransferase RlmN [Myxococcota bacterium]